MTTFLNKFASYNVMENPEDKIKTYLSRNELFNGPWGFHYNLEKLVTELSAIFEDNFRGLLFSQESNNNLGAELIWMEQYSKNSSNNIIPEDYLYQKCIDKIEECSQKIKKATQKKIIPTETHRLFILPKEEFIQSSKNNSVFEYEIKYKEPELTRQLAIQILTQRVLSNITILKENIIYNAQKDKYRDLHAVNDHKYMIRQKRIHEGFSDNKQTYKNTSQRWSDHINKALAMANSWEKTIDNDAYRLTKILALASISNGISREKINSIYHNQLPTASELLELKQN